MNSLKTVAVVAVLAVVAYAVFVTINQPYKTPPPEAADADTGVPDVSGLPQPGATDYGAAPGGEMAPPFSSAGSGGSMSTVEPGGMAPPFNPNEQAPPFNPNQQAPPFNGNQQAPPFNPPGGVHPGSGATPPPSTAVGGVSTPPPGAGTYPAPPPARDIHSEFASFLEDCQRRLKAGEWPLVHLALSRWYGQEGLSEEETARLNDLLDRLAGSIIYGREYHLLEEAYEVQPGESLDMIAQKYNVPWQLLAKINGIPDRRAVQAGQRLKVLRGPFKAHVDLSRQELTLFLHSRYAGRFPIGVGREFAIEEGVYFVNDKVENPAYDTDTFIDRDDPNNPYGEFRIGLVNSTQTYVPLAIHGTNDPANVGRQPDRGSICLGTPDIEDVFDILSVGSQVVVRR